MKSLFYILPLLSLLGCGESAPILEKSGDCMFNGKRCRPSPSPTPTAVYQPRNGHNAVIDSYRYDAGLTMCPTQSGLVIQTGIDMDDSNTLESNEIRQVQPVRDGAMGQNGKDGADAPVSPYNIIGVIDPCGKQSAFDEVLLKTSSGKLLAHFSSGSNQFLVELSAGNYVTTDGTGCKFTVTSGNEITNERN